MPVLGSGKDTPAIPGGDAGGASPPETYFPCVSRHNLSSDTEHSVTHPVLSRAEQLKLDKVKMKAAYILLSPIGRNQPSASMRYAAAHPPSLITIT